jgi:hypothetical protein
MQFIKLTYPLLSSSLAEMIKRRALWLADSAILAERCAVEETEAVEDLGS